MRGTSILLSATLLRILLLGLVAPGWADETQLWLPGLGKSNISPPCFLPPSASPSVCSVPHLGPTLCGLCPAPISRGPAAALLCHLLSHPAAHPLHVYQPLPGHLYHLHHLPQCGHHVPGALQSAPGEPCTQPQPWPEVTWQGWVFSRTPLQGQSETASECYGALCPGSSQLGRTDESQGMVRGKGHLFLVRWR